MNEKHLKAVIHSRTPLHEGFLRVYEYEFDVEEYRGGMARLSREVMERGNAVAVLGHDPNRNEVVLGNEFRPGVLVAGDYPFRDNLIAGSIDENETALEAAVREMQEETGLILSDPVLAPWSRVGGIEALPVLPARRDPVRALATVCFGAIKSLAFSKTKVGVGQRRRSLTGQDRTLAVMNSLPEADSPTGPHGLRATGSSLCAAPLKIGFPYLLSRHTHLKLSRHHGIFPLVNQLKLWSGPGCFGREDRSVGVRRRDIVVNNMTFIVKIDSF